MSESAETPDSSSTDENESPGSPPPPNGGIFQPNLQYAGGGNSSAAPPPSSDSSSPPDDDSLNDQSVPPPPSDTESPETSPPGDNSPPQSTPPPPSEKSPPQSPPPSPSKQQSPPPNPPKQQSPPPPSSPSQDPSQSSPENSPPPPSPSPPPPKDSSGSSSPSPPPPPPAPPNTTSTPSYTFSAPSLNGTTTSSPGFSPQALAPPPPPPSKTHSNSSDGSSSSNSGGSTNSQNNNNAKNPYDEAVVGATVVGAFIVAFLVFFFFLRRSKKRRGSPHANYMPPPANFSVTTDAYVGNSAQIDTTYYNSQFHGHQHSNSVNSFGSQRAMSYHGPDSGIIAGSKTFFSYEELMEMTNGYSRQNIIGEGGFGCVFKGWMPDGRVVAVKQLKAGSGQGEREFRAEVEIISRVHHRHLVSLVGYCIAENQRLLIYEFVANNTLEYHLHAKDLPVLEWVKRVKIAVGAAKGLAYLHEDCHPKIIHRDIKSANILLEDDFEAQVADFGLARLNDTTQTHVSTRVMGTFGYLAPEYASSGKLTDRSDVFSFGVVLLELITGRKPVDPTQPLGDESLVEWARPLLIKALETGDLGEVVDPRLEKRYVESQMFRMIEAAAACVRHSAAKRPRMALVVRALDFEGESDDLSNGVKFGQSTVYDSGQYSQDIVNFRRMALENDNSSESDMYSGEYNSREVSRGQPNSMSRYSSGDFTSGESETRAFKPSGGEYSGASGNYDRGRFR